MLIIASGASRRRRIPFVGCLRSPSFSYSSHKTLQYTGKTPHAPTGTQERDDGRRRSKGEINPTPWRRVAAYHARWRHGWERISHSEYVRTIGVRAARLSAAGAGVQVRPGPRPGELRPRQLGDRPVRGKSPATGGDLHEIQGRVCWSNDAAEGTAQQAPGFGITFTSNDATNTLARELEDLEL